MNIDEVIRNETYRTGRFTICPAQHDYTFSGKDRTTKTCENGYPYEIGNYGTCDHGCKTSNSNLWSKKGKVGN
jgi:hypothetical protein